MDVTVRRLEPALRTALDRFFDSDPGCAWCRCVAWWVPTWEGFGERTAEENRALRAELLARGEDDGYLAFDGEEPVGWCQVGPRDRLEKLVRGFALDPEPGTWAVTCFAVRADLRRRGVARRLLAAVLDDLPARGARSVEAYPKRGAEALGEPGELWNGPEALFAERGFRVVGEAPPRVRMALELAPG